MRRRPTASRAICLVGADPRRDVAGMALGEELDRQRHDLPEKRLIMTTESLVCSLSSSDCCTSVKIARTNAVTAMPISSGRASSSVCWIRISSMKILEKPAATMPGTTSARLTRTSSPTAAFEPRNSRSSKRSPAACCRPSKRLAVGSIASTTPVKPLSSSSMPDARAPDGRVIDIDASALDALRGPRND